MGFDSIEASLGLASALSILKQYQETGVLQGKISIARFLKTIHCQCTIHIENGDVTFCQLVDEQGFPIPTEKDQLIQIDQKRGPFEWTFYSYSSPMPSALVSNPVMSVRDDMILVRLIYEPHFGPLEARQESDLKILQQIFSLVNGQRTVREIKALMKLRLSPSAVEKTLIFLITRQYVAIQN